jgi:outer membrane lipopolysaccharide assembly protein LptE/RlpB
LWRNSLDTSVRTETVYFDFLVMSGERAFQQTLALFKQYYEQNSDIASISNENETIVVKMNKTSPHSLPYKFMSFDVRVDQSDVVSSHS